MNKLRKAVSLLLCMLLVLPAVSAFAADRAVQPENAVLDTDGSDGYSGDYVVIYNPADNKETGYNTGDLTGLIQTAAGDKISALPASDAELDITPALLAKDDIEAEALEARFSMRAEEIPYEPGDTRVFTLNNHSPLGTQVEFKVLAKGAHCYVWTPTSTAENVYPLDSIDESYGQIACDRFDACYPLLAEYLDAVSSSVMGNRISLLYYNIDDGWVSGQPYIGGFFSSADSYSNGIPVLSLDTYPGVYHPTEDGGWDSRFERSFGIAVHEYQHMVNFLRASGRMDLWLNEAMSSATEEFCYPGSCLVQRIPGWVNNNITGSGQQIEAPVEYEYTADFAVHNGASLYAWNDTDTDVGALYGRITLFSQYLYSHFGNEVFHEILMNYKTLGSARATLLYATGVSMTELVRRFNIALTANDPEGELSFAMQSGYDPEQYYNVDNLYSWLSPVVYTGAGLTICGGASVTVKPVGGVYYPPEDADPGLVYIGVDVAGEVPGSEPDHGIKGDTDGNGAVNANDALMALRYALHIITLDEDALWRADVDGNGITNANDALMILRYALHIIPSL